MEPMLTQGIGEVSLGDQLKLNLDLAKQYGATAPKELLLVSKQLMYFERYAKTLAPNYVLARDLFLLKNVFPEAVAEAARERGVVLPE